MVIDGAFSNLDPKLYSWFRYDGPLEDLQEAIHRAEQAVAATPNNYPDLAQRVGSLSKKLHSRFKGNGRLSVSAVACFPT